jgi:hypothetical protein
LGISPSRENAEENVVRPLRQFQKKGSLKALESVSLLGRLRMCCSMTKSHPFKVAKVQIFVHKLSHPG